jgi:hypothetical protein
MHILMDDSSEGAVGHGAGFVAAPGASRLNHR